MGKSRYLVLRCGQEVIKITIKIQDPFSNLLMKIQPEHLHNPANKQTNKQTNKWS